MQERLAAAHAEQRRGIELAVAHLVGQADVEALRRGVLGRGVAGGTLAGLGRLWRPRATGTRPRYRDRPATAARARGCGGTPSGRATSPRRPPPSAPASWSRSTCGPGPRAGRPTRSRSRGPSRRRPSSEGIRLAAPKEPSPSVSLRSPLVWPSVWQLWQLIQPSCESLASWKSRSPRSARRRLRPGPQRDRRDAAAALELDDRDRVVEAVGDVDRLAVGPAATAVGRRPRRSGARFGRARRRSRPRPRPRARRSGPPFGSNASAEGSPAPLPTSPRSRRRLRFEEVGPGGLRTRPGSRTRTWLPTRSPQWTSSKVVRARGLSVWWAIASDFPPGARASPRMLCAGRVRTERSVPVASVDQGELAAEGVGDDEPGLSGQLDHLARAEGELDRPDRLQSRPARSRPSSSTVRRRDQREATTQEAPARRRRRGPGRG